jgi:hypothetical protein
MRDTHKILFLGALAGGILYMVRRARSLERELRDSRTDDFDAADARSSIDDLPTLSPQRSRSDADVERLDETVAPTAPF